MGGHDHDPGVPLLGQRPGLVDHPVRDVDQVDRLESVDLVRGQTWYALPAAAARLDALAALKERTRVERDAPPLLRAGTYLEPFALRALGAGREDELLIEQAIDRFNAMGLTWHAEQSRKLLAPT